MSKKVTKVETNETVNATTIETTETVELGTTSESDKEVVETRKPEFAINAMRDAIIDAHNYPKCNKHAITEKEALENGATSERFNQWVHWVENLREVIVEYCEVKQSKSATTEELAVAKGRIYPAWRTILKVGEEDVFHKNMFVRPEDVDSLVGYCETFMATVKGTQFANTTKVVFRKYVESLLGCRIAGNAVLKDADRDTLAEFYAAERTIDKATKALNGTEKTSKGTTTHVKGIIENIADLTTRISDGEKMLKGFGLSEEEIAQNSLLGTLRASLRTLEEEKKSAEKSKADAEETKENLTERVEQIENMLNSL